MGKEIVNQVQEVQRVTYRINPRSNTPRHILIKLSKIKYKEKILKAAREQLRKTICRGGSTTALVTEAGFSKNFLQPFIYLQTF